MAAIHIFAGFVIAYLAIIGLASLLSNPAIFVVGVVVLFIVFVVLAVIEVKRATKKR